MKKRINLAWRIGIALLLLFALAPVVALSVPAQAAVPPETYIDPISDYVNSLNLITGTSSSSAPLEVATVKVQISYEEAGTTYYWDENIWDWLADIGKWGGAFVPDPSTSVVPWQWDWVYDTSAIPWDDGQTYDIKAKAVDETSEPDPSPATESFIFDDTPPNTTVDAIADPYHGTPTETLTSITGTAEDSAPGKIDAVWVTIIRSDWYYWCGTAWVPSLVWLPATATDGSFDSASEDWEITSTTAPSLPPGWKHQETYTVNAMAVDKADNIDFLAVPVSFLYDVTLTGLDVCIDPIPEYAADFSNVAWEVTGTSKAAAGQTVTWVQLKIRCNTDSKYWNGWDWQDGVTWDLWAVATSGAFVVDNEVDWAYWGVPFWEDSKDYSIWARVKDSAGDMDTTAEVSFIFDDTEPSSSIDAIPDPVYNSLPAITGTSADSSPGEVDSVWMEIWDMDSGLFWDGTGWGIFWTTIPTKAADGSFDSASEDWEISSTTTPPLPEWQNGVPYRIVTWAYDKAGNPETTSVKWFTYWVNLTLPMPTPTPTTPTPTPTPTPGPPVLSSISWIDVDISGNITEGDELRFNFSEEMDTATITEANIDTRLPTVPSHTYGTLTSDDLDWNTAETELTVTLGSGEAIEGGETVNPSSDVKSAAGLSDTTTGDGPEIPTTPATPTPTPTPTPTIPPTPTVTPTPTPTATPTPTPTPTAPVLSQITWDDVDDSKTIDQGDRLVFQFSKSMNTATISNTNIDARLPTNPSHTYGTLTAAALSWSNGNKWLTVTLGAGEEIEGGETVNPTDSVKDTDGMADATTAPGQAIPEEEGFVWEWWYFLLIGLGAVIIIAAIVLLVVLPKRGGGEEFPEEELYGEEEEEEF